MSQQTATFAAGCFWGVEARFRELPGIVDAACGYMGGHVSSPTYRQVCQDNTGHAEVVQLVFDDEEISYNALLDVFFDMHNPTTLNRQGNDVGTQYRSAIFYSDDAQKATAEAKLKEVGGAGIWKDPIVTEIAPLDAFYSAEDYHRDYFARNPGQPYCQAVVAPKVAKFRKMHVDRLKKAARDS